MSNAKPLTCWIDVGGQEIRVREAKGVEAISEPFRYEIRFAEDEGKDLDPDALIRKEATFRLVRDGDERKVKGIVTEIKVGVALNRPPEVFLVLEPNFSIAAYRTDIRLFRDKTAPVVVTEVLNGLGIAFELRLQGTYEKRPYCVQMRETDMDFVKRLLEDEGIFYFFTDEDVMVLGDHSAAYEPSGPTLPFHAGAGMDMHEDAVFSVGQKAAMGPSKLTLRDFNPDHPSLDMEVKATTPLPGGPEFYDYPGEYLDPGFGRKKIALRAEAVTCNRAAVLARTFSAKLYPGLIFRVDGAPAPIEDGAYVVRRLEHHFLRTQDGYSNQIEMLHEDVIFRPEVKTVAPTLHNPMTGFVTGPPEADIHTNDMGQVKVHFHWDRLFPHDDTCSHWIPILQDNTGHSVAISRTKWEVLVHFLEGDPDRPVVLGRVYNAEDNFPQRLPEEKTRSALKSLSSPRVDGDINGTNEIQFDDIAGSERIFMHAEKDMNVVVANDKTEQITNNETRVIKRDETIVIGGDETVNVGGDVTPGVQGDQIYFVAGSRTVTVEEADAATVGGNRTVTIGGDHTRTITTNDRCDVKDDFEETIGGASTETSDKNNRFEVSKVSDLKVGGSLIESAKAGKMSSASKGRDETIGGDVFSSTEDITATRIDETRTSTVKGNVAIAAVKDIVMTGRDEKLKTLSETGAFTGTKITFRVGKSEISMKDGKISIKANDIITVDAEAENNLGAGISTQI
ncbi:MAG: type VI secretion system tip protein TssI/VgrG [Minicystis sp.]